jgi:hypothetical protein
LNIQELIDLMRRDEVLEPLEVKASRIEVFHSDPKPLEDYADFIKEILEKRKEKMAKMEKKEKSQ